MFDYHKAALVVGPRMAALEVKEVELAEAIGGGRAARGGRTGWSFRVDSCQTNCGGTITSWPACVLSMPPKN